MNKNAYLIDLSGSTRTDFGRVAFARQSRPQKVFSAIWALESEVNNGGFLQYFSSDSRETANFAANALRRIGAMQCAAIVKQAVIIASPALLADSSDDPRSIDDALDEASRAKLHDLDAQFFAYPDNLTELLFDFVSAHPEEFGAIR